SDGGATAPGARRERGGARRRQRIGALVVRRQSTEVSVQEGPKPLHLRRGGMRLCERRELMCQIDRRLQRGQGRTVLLIPVGGQLLQSAELAKILPPAQRDIERADRFARDLASIVLE